MKNLLQYCTFVVACLFAGSTYFHALALTWPSISPGETPDVHVLFAFVNLWLMFETVERRPDERGRLYFSLVLLTLHQVPVHGWMLATGQAVAQDIGVFVGLAAIWALLVIDHYRKE